MIAAEKGFEDLVFPPSAAQRVAEEAARPVTEELRRRAQAVLLQNAALEKAKKLSPGLMQIEVNI